MNKFLAKHRLCLCLAAAVCLAALSGCGPGQLGHAKLLGTWKAVSVEMEGQPLEGHVARNIQVIFANQQDVTFVTDGDHHKGVCEVDRSAEPRRITIRPAEGNITDKHLFGIFTVDGDDLVLCVSQRRTPPAFATKKGYDYVLIKLKRKGSDLEKSK